MKRAIFVTVGTIAGLTATLRYTPDNPLLTAGTDLALGAPQTLGGTQTQAPSAQGSPNVPHVAASKSVGPTPTKSAKPQQVVVKKTSTPIPVKTTVAKPKATPAKTPKSVETTKPKPVKTTKPKPVKTTKPKPVKTTKPKPKPTKTATPPASISVTGNTVQAGFYGPVKVRIQVANGLITSITPLKWPTGDTSISISGYAIPLLIQDALRTQSANVATISGASYTSQAFMTSLASAMAKAGL